MGGFALAFRQEGRKEGRGQPEASTKAGSTNCITHPGRVMTTTDTDRMQDILLTHLCSTLCSAKRGQAAV